MSLTGTAKQRLWGMPRRHWLKRVGGKRGNAAFAQEIVAEKGDGWRVGRPYSRLDYAALISVSLSSPRSRPSRSAAPWQPMQRAAHGTAARRFGLISHSHSIQVPKVPS